MQPFAVTMARNGYVALTFDFPGHGRNGMPLPGGIGDHEASGRALLAALGEVASFGRTLPQGDGQIALLGHSMASDVVVRYAPTDPAVKATIAVSLFSPNVTASSPRNLLIVVGALEPAFLQDEARRVVGMTAGMPAHEGTTYGSFADGTARRFVLADGVEHIGVLYSRDSMAEALDWMHRTMGRSGITFQDRRGPWLGLMYLGIVVLAWPLSRLLPRLPERSSAPALRWPRFLAIAILPALLTPLILWKLPTDFLPLLLGDYLALHFAVYGLLTFAGLKIGGLLPATVGANSTSHFRLAVAALAASVYVVLGIAGPTDWFVTSYWPTTERLPLILGMLCGTLPFFAADEYLTRRPTGPRGAYLLTKLSFAVSLLLAVALNFQKLFFLLIIVPAIVVFFTVHGLFGSWIYRQTRHPMAGAVALSLAMAWGIAVTFPIAGH